MNILGLLAGTLAIVLISGFGVPAFALSPVDVKDWSLTIPEDVRTPDEINEVQQTPWNEVGDAGELPASAQRPIGSGPITSISGSLSFPDDIDMYQICITDIDAFKAETGGMGTANFDTMLSIFDASGGGVVLNDDFVPYGFLSKIDSSSPFAPTTPGEYLLAIHPFFSEPLDGGSFMISAFIFDDGTYFELIGTVDEWNLADIVTGDYEIALGGVSHCQIVGGQSLAIDTTALIIAGASANAVWILPVLAGLAGAGFYLIKFRTTKE